MTTWLDLGDVLLSEIYYTQKASSTLPEIYLGTHPRFLESLLTWDHHCNFSSILIASGIKLPWAASGYFDYSRNFWSFRWKQNVKASVTLQLLHSLCEVLEYQYHMKDVIAWPQSVVSLSLSLMAAVPWETAYMDDWRKSSLSSVALGAGCFMFSWYCSHWKVFTHLQPLCMSLYYVYREAHMYWSTCVQFRGQTWASILIFYHVSHSVSCYLLLYVLDIRLESFLEFPCLYLLFHHMIAGNTVL